MTAFSPTKQTATLEGVEGHRPIFVGMIGSIHGHLFVDVGPFYLPLNPTTEPNTYLDNQKRSWTVTAARKEPT